MLLGAGKVAVDVPYVVLDQSHQLLRYRLAGRLRGRRCDAHARRRRKPVRYSLQPLGLLRGRGISLGGGTHSGAAAVARFSSDGCRGARWT